ncbi:MAG: cytochrome c [Rhizobiaceae bacterium]
MNRIPLFLAVAGVVAIGAAYGLHMRFNPGRNLASGMASGEALVAVTMPTLTDTAERGEALFNDNCAGCHGANAAGRAGKAPPLVHRIYEPNHHGDGAFFRAAQSGVRQHHWPFGDMPPIGGVDDSEIAMIVTYVRELQRANGIN